jgi:hypothetical protein
MAWEMSRIKSNAYTATCNRLTASYPSHLRQQE